MNSALVAGALYFAAAFMLGAALGALRVTTLVPKLGETAAVAAELPIMLAASWMICGALTRRLCVPPLWRYRLFMGALALVLLIGAETLLGLALGRSLGAQLASYASPPGALGLAGQLAFAAFPLLQARAAR